MQIWWDLPGERRSLKWLTEKEAQPAKGWLQVDQKVERDERLLFFILFFPPKDHTLPPEPTWVREKDALVSDKTFIRNLALLELVFIFWFLKTHFCQVSLVTNSNPAPMSNINHTGRWFMDRSLINALESGFCLQSSQLYLVQGKIHSSWQF